MTQPNAARPSTSGSTSVLDIRDLRFRYPRSARASDAPDADRPWVVDIPALAVAPGEQVLLTARSGYGKSTLLQLIAGLLDPQEGTVKIDGVDIHDLHGASRDRFRGRHIGMIFQTFNILHGFSALENVMAALMFSAIPPSEHKPRAQALLTRLQIDRPNADADSLSVGQQQRIAVARALACDPVLVLADEPTASLDPENAEGAVRLIQEACREKNAALVCVSHDPSLAQRFERRQRLDHAPQDQQAPQPAHRTAGAR